MKYRNLCILSANLIVLSVTLNSGAESSAIVLNYPQLENTTTESISTTSFVELEFTDLANIEKEEPISAWYENAASLLSKGGDSILDLVSDIGDNRTAERRTAANQLVQWRELLCKGNAVASFVGQGSLQGESFGVFRLTCPNRPQGIYALVPTRAKSGKYTYDPEAWGSLAANVLRMQLPFEIVERSLIQPDLSRVVLDSTASVVLRARIENVAELDEKRRLLVEEYEAFWKGLHTELESDRGGLPQLLSRRFSQIDRVVGDLNQFGESEWLEMMRHCGHAIGLMDLGDIKIILNRAYCEDIKNLKARTFSELLVTGNDWKIVNYKFIHSFQNLLVDNDVRSQICHECGITGATFTDSAIN